MCASLQDAAPSNRSLSDCILMSKNKSLHADGGLKKSQQDLKAFKLALVSAIGNILGMQRVRQLCGGLFEQYYFTSGT